MRSRVSTPGRSSTGATARAVDDGRLDADLAGAAVEHQQVVAELVATCAARGRADAAEAVGARRGDARHAEAARGLAAARARPDAPGSAGRWSPARRPRRRAMPGRRAHDHRQRPGPEGVDQALRDRRQRVGEARRRRRASATWTISGWLARPALEREDAGDRGVVVGARAEAVDRLGRKGDQLAGGDSAARRSSIAAGIEPVEPHRARSRASRRRCSDSRAGGRAARRAPRPSRRRRGDVRWPILRPRPRLGLAVQVQVHAGQRQHVGPVGLGRRGARAHHRSPSRLSITHGECRRGATSGAPVIARTCSSNCDTSQASML